MSYENVGKRTNETIERIFMKTLFSSVCVNSSMTAVK